MKRYNLIRLLKEMKQKMIFEKGNFISDHTKATCGRIDDLSDAGEAASVFIKCLVARMRSYLFD